MQIKSILDMTYTKNIAQIAKEHLTIGEKPLRQTLKVIGCEQNKGQRGWFYNGTDASVLEQSIYDYVTPSNRTTPSKVTPTTTNASTIESEAVSTNENTSTNKVTSEIQSLLSSKPKVDRVYKGVYFDSDIADFLASVPSGNKSDIINKIMRTYLKENGFL